MKRPASSRRKSEGQHPADIDAWLSEVPPQKRAALQKIRKAVKAAAPRAEESFSYGLPALRLDGRPLVCFGASANHCSFYPMSPAVIRAHAADLNAYETSKGTIRFTADAPLPAGLVKKLVKARMAELKRAHDESM